MHGTMPRRQRSCRARHFCLPPATCHRCLRQIRQLSHRSAQIISSQPKRYVVCNESIIVQLPPDCSPVSLVFVYQYEPDSSRGFPSLSASNVGNTLFSQLRGGLWWICFYKHCAACQRQLSLLVHLAVISLWPHRINELQTVATDDLGICLWYGFAVQTQQLSALETCVALGTLLRGKSQSPLPPSLFPYDEWSGEMLFVVSYIDMPVVTHLHSPGGSIQFARQYVTLTACVTLHYIRVI